MSGKLLCSPQLFLLTGLLIFDDVILQANPSCLSGGNLPQIWMLVSHLSATELSVYLVTSLAERVSLCGASMWQAV